MIIQLRKMFFSEDKLDYFQTIEKIIFRRQIILFSEDKLDYFQKTNQIIFRRQIRLFSEDKLDYFQKANQIIFRRQIRLFSDHRLDYFQKTNQIIFRRQRRFLLLLALYGSEKVLLAGYPGSIPSAHTEPIGRRLKCLNQLVNLQIVKQNQSQGYLKKIKSTKTVETMATCRFFLVTAGRSS